MYRQDSFFDLSAFGQIGLVVISTILFLLILFAAWKLLSPRGPVIRILGALALYWVFVWASPQIYYMYYWMIFPNLPLQWVIWPPVGLERAIQMLFFQYRHNLSAHFQGVLGWCLLVTPFAQDFWQRLKR
ncbi:MAG: hypothetical protein ABJL67_07640 [Sulfitobacter sp.]